MQSGGKFKITPQFRDDLKVYAALALVTVMALVITFSKIKVVEIIDGTPDPNVSTFKPLKQRTASKIMYTGDGFLPEDWYFFHSKGKMSDRAYKSIRILDTLRWTGPTTKTVTDKAR